MSNTKYKGRSYLVSYDLSSELFQHYNLTVNDLIPMKTSFLLKTDEGDKLLKKMECSIDDLKFINSGINYIKNNCGRVMNFVKSDDDKIYTICNNEIYCIIDLVKGRECKYSSNEDVAIVARGLGDLHNASEGFRYENFLRYNCGNLIHNLNRKLEEVKFFKQIVKFYECSKKFDELFIDNVEQYIEQIEKSISIIKSCRYYKICSEEDKIVLCHNNFDRYNIIIKDDKAYFMNFNNATIDIKVWDVYRLISKVIKNYNYDIKEAELILENYCLTNDLDKRELKLLYGILCFPEDFYNISKDYYTRRKRWDEQTFEIKFKSRMKNLENKRCFLEQFEKLIK